LNLAKLWLARIQDILKTRVNAPTRLSAQSLQAFWQLSLEAAIAGERVEEIREVLALLPASARSSLLLRAQAVSTTWFKGPSELSEVKEQLELWLSSHADDAAVWEALAKVFLTQGLGVRAVRAQAEARIAHLDYAAGLDRLKAARDLSLQQKSDFFELSIIESRLKQIEVLQREQAREEAAER
jgi:predicted Zn-dependent protease